MPTPRTGVTAVVLNDLVYVLGGKDETGAIVNIVERYDPSTNTWDTAPVMDRARFNAAAVVLNGQIYIMGGRGSNNETLSNTAVFDPSTQVWSAVDDLQVGREGLAAVVLDNTIYVMGGSNANEQILNTVEYYDESANRWRDFFSWQLQVGSASFASVSLSDSAYVFGGFSSFGPLSLVQRYHATEGVQEKAPVTPARGGLSAAVLENAVYVIGGRIGNNEVIATVNRFLPAENTWELAEPLNEARENAPAVFIDDQIIVFGGNNEAGDVLGSVEAYNTVVVPLASNDSASTPEDTSIAISVLTNDSDPAGEELTIIGFTQPDHGTTTQIDAGTLNYQPDPNYVGTDLFSYSIENESGGVALATVQLIVDPVNDAPNILTTPVRSALIDAVYTYDLSAEDVDGDPLIITAGPLPMWLQLLDGGDNTARLSGTPTQDDVGPFDIELFISDGLDTTRQSFQLSVVNAAPTVPGLLMPADDSNIPQAPVSFTWSESEGNTYQFQLSTDDLFLSVQVDTTVIAPPLVFDELSEAKYFWRVRAINAAGTSEWSSTFTFRFGTSNVGNEEELPRLDFTLHPAYPNPFQVTAVIPFEIQQSGKQVEVTVFDLSGRKITTLLSRTLPLGTYQVQWDGMDADGRPAASSRYIIQLRVGDLQQTQVLMLIR